MTYIDNNRKEQTMKNYDAAFPGGGIESVSCLNKTRVTIGYVNPSRDASSVAGIEALVRLAYGTTGKAYTQRTNEPFCVLTIPPAVLNTAAGMAQAFIDQLFCEWFYDLKRARARLRELVDRFDAQGELDLAAQDLQAGHTFAQKLSKA